VTDSGVQVRLIGSGISTPTPAPTFTPVPSPTPSPIAFITIVSPRANEAVSLAGFTVTGEAGGLFENSFVIELIDVQGQVVGRQTVTYSSPEAGLPGRFSVNVVPNVRPVGTQGSLHAFATSPQDGRIIVETFVPVTLAVSQR
jgi:hypothetical protein